VGKYVEYIDAFVRLCILSGVVVQLAYEIRIRFKKMATNNHDNGELRIDIGYKFKVAITTVNLDNLYRTYIEGLTAPVQFALSRLRQCRLNFHISSTMSH
jgi:hypothetical protein